MLVQYSQRERVPGNDPYKYNMLDNKILASDNNENLQCVLVIFFIVSSTFW